jgi:MYXO-CTERM domain-containing protein
MILKLTAVIGIVAALVATSLSARADIPPPDASSNVGSSCTYNGKAGTCKQQTCSRRGPSGAYDHPCNLCDTSAPAPKASGSNAASPAVPSKCSFAVPGAGPAGGALLAGVGVAFVAARRSRRRR